jgi:DNA polymerase I-like protein with 3'-5' exonuclease and polymerase domains
VSNTNNGSQSGTNVAAAPQFYPEHQDYLADRAIPLDLATAAGLRSVDGVEAAELLGRSSALYSSGIAIPYPGLDPAYYRFRLDDPDLDGGARYLAPGGREVPVYRVPGQIRPAAALPPGLQGALVIVESPIKALALTAAGLEAVGLGGTGTTLDLRNGIRRLNSTWAAVPVAGRDVIICFDAGRATNPNVARDEARLAQALSHSGSAVVRVAALPLKNAEEDQGPDDFIASAGASSLMKVLADAVPAAPLNRIAAQVGSGAAAADLLDDMPFMYSVIEATPATKTKIRSALGKAGVSSTDLKSAVKRIEEAADSVSAKDGAALGDHLAVVDGRICKTPGGSVPLCNFDARILEERFLDDGTECQKKIVVGGTLASGTPLPKVTLKWEDLRDPLWPNLAWGSVPALATRKGVVDDVRLAMQLFSKPAVHTTYSHTGWRTLKDATGAESGVPVFLTSAGALGGTGVSVELEGRLAYYSLPPEPGDLTEAVRTSLKLLDLGPSQVMFPLLALPFRAPLQSVFPADFSAFLTGPTGTFKTAIAKLGAAHFGAALADSPITSFESSVSHIEMVLHCLKDVLALVDDFKPASTHPKDEHQSKARHVFSAIGNQEGRGRQRSDGSMRPARPPRALVLSTGETVPVGESTVARLLVLPLRKGDVKMRQLSDAQANVEALPHTMSGYIQYLQPKLDHLRGRLKARHAELREQFRKAGEGAHLRSPSAIAHAALGLELLWEFAQHVGAITPARARDLEAEAAKALTGLCVQGVEHARETDPSLRFLDFLRGQLDQGALLLEADLTKPLAQRREKDAVIGEPVGWHDDDFYYFLSEPTYQAIVVSMAAAKEPMPLGALPLWRRLRDQGLIEKSDRPGRLLRREQLGGRRTDVIVMRKSVLDPEGDGEGHDGGGGGGGGGGSASVRQAPSDDGDFAPPEEPTNRTSDPANRTGEGANRTSPAATDAGNPHAQVAGIPSLPESRAPSTGTVGTVGTVSREEKSRERASPETSEGDAAHVAGSASLLRKTGPTGPDAHDGATPRNDGSSFAGTDSAPRTGPDQPDQTHVAGRVPVADGLSYLRQVPSAAAKALFCIRTAKRLLGEKDLKAADYHRHAELQVRLREAGLSAVAELEFDLFPVLADMERVGVGVDVVAWAELVRLAQVDAADTRVTLAGFGLENPGDDAKVRAALTARGLPSARSSRKTLAPHMADPLVSELIAYRRSAGFLDSAGRAVLAAAQQGNGRVKAKFDPLAAPTGRMSCSKPNLLAIPRDPEYRRCFVPARGNLLVVADYSAIDLRVLAEVTGDPVLQKVFVEGGDPHRATASAVLGKAMDDVTKDERQRAKAINFGFAFGMGPAKFVEYALASYGVTLPQEEAVAARAAFLDAYPHVAAWQRRVHQEMPLAVRTLGGRRRLFPNANDGYCERLNTPIQGTAADGMKTAMVLLHPRLREFDARMVLAVHDELLVEVPEDHAGAVRAVVERTMVEGMQRFVRSVPIKVESSVRRNWADPVTN